MYYPFNRYLPSKTIFVWVTEFTMLFLITIVPAALMNSSSIEGAGGIHGELIKTALPAAVYALFFYYFDLYSHELFRPDRQTLLRLIKATGLATGMLFFIYFIFPQLRIWEWFLLANIALLPGLFFGWRKVFSKWLHLELPTKKVLILGSGVLAKKIGAEVHSESAHGLKLVGFIDDDPSMLGKSIVNPGVIGSYAEIGRIVNSEKIDLIIIALQDRRAKLPMTALLECKLKGVRIEESETFKERLTGKVPLEHLKPSWMIFSEGFNAFSSLKLFKRALDILTSSIVLAFASPIMLLTAVLIRLESKGPAIFKQQRVGENGQVFNIFKFRSMRNDAEAATGPVWANARDPRITRIGKVIRKTRIDELPQLINVLKGDMSFVGPRPERPFFVEKLRATIPYYDIRSNVKPGITGWAQIKYPYGATVEDAIEKLQYDLYYIKNMSPILDILIIFWTVKVVLSGKGAR